MYKFVRMGITLQEYNFGLRYTRLNRLIFTCRFTGYQFGTVPCPPSLDMPSASITLQEGIVKSSQALKEINLVV